LLFFSLIIFERSSIAGSPRSSPTLSCLAFAAIASSSGGGNGDVSSGGRSYQFHATVDGSRNQIATAVGRGEEYGRGRDGDGNVRGSPTLLLLIEVGLHQGSNSSLGRLEETKNLNSKNGQMDPLFN
jgi:hypothetical protein